MHLLAGSFSSQINLLNPIITGIANGSAGTITARDCATGEPTLPRDVFVYTTPESLT